MGHVSRHGKFAPMLLVIGIAAACTVGAASTFTLSSASVAATYTCPLGATDAPYDLKAVIDVRNSTSSTVTIKSVSAAMTLVAVKGTWLEKVGEKYQASDVGFSPQTVAAGSSASLKVILPSACTNGKAAVPDASYADYSIAFTVVTSAGTHTIVSKNKHRIIAT
jgi:hypothetical protein